MSADPQFPDPSAIPERGMLFIENIVQQLVDLSRRNAALNFREKSAIALALQPQTVTTSLTGVRALDLPSLIGNEPTPDQLKTLKQLFERSRLLTEERGVQVLHIALGLLNWKDDQSGKTYNAPLMLMPVELLRTGNIYKLKRAEGSDVEPNRTLIELLRRHPTTRYTGSEVAEDITYADFSAMIMDAVPLRSERSISDVCHLGLFSYEKMAMVEDVESNARVVLEHPIISALNGDPEPLAMLQHGIEMPLPAHLDYATTTSDRVYITEADSSQQEALEAIARGLSLVIQGPPGTGKSQTIVNIIAQALLDAKSVLFVAEKKVALDVVFNRLDERGLGDAILAVQRDDNKKRFASMLSVRHSDLSNGTFEHGAFRNTSSALLELDSYRRELHTPVGASGLTPFTLYGRQSPVAADTLLDRIEGVERINPDERERLGESVERLSAYPEWLRRPATAKWSSLRLDVSDLSAVNSAREAMVSGRRLALDLLRIRQQSEPIVGLGYELDAKGVEALATCLELVADAPVVPEHWLRSSVDEPAAALARYESERDVYESNRLSLLDRYQADVFDTDLDRLAERFLGEYDRFWKRWFNQSYATDLREVLDKRLDAHRSAVFAEIREELAVLRATKSERAQWSSPTHKMRVAFGSLFEGVQTSPADLRSALSWLRRFIEVRKDHAVPTTLAVTLTTASKQKRIEALNLAEQLRVAQSGIVGCERSLSLIFHDIPEETSSWPEYLGTKLDAFEEVPRYLQHRRWLNDLRANGCSSFVSALQSDASLDASKWRNAFEQVVDASLVDFAHMAHESLAVFEREAHERLRARYAEADQENVAKGADRVRAKLRSNARSKMAGASYNESIRVIMAEATKSRNVAPIRRLTRQAFDAIKVLKPCIMMSPLAVSQYLPPGQVFDLVIFDEASQMRPADAIAALSRGQQVVVVGDEHQLPPTSFFDNAISSDSEEEPDADSSEIADYESILNRCATVLQQRMLRWHYRSRHESLISFSNREFYSSRLVTFPTPANRPGLGIRLFSSKSSYARGGSRQNRGEARDVAKLAIEHARTRPQETLGIIAFSQAQQRAIEDALEIETRANPDCAEFFADSRSSSERVFVKNLESVQGDERDVIVLSIGYGRDEDGKLSYNFGPLNRSGGGRRLNVAVTRAKNEMIVASSIDDRDLDAEKCREGGNYLVRSYLAHARTGGELGGIVQATGRGEDSPFERDVRMVLTGMGYKVHTQVGASGYRLDLAVCHPTKEGDYVLAVECDGATYHGTPTARDRDRLRDRTLQTFGWKIYRIWSRDWFRRRAAEISRLQTAVEESIRAYGTPVPIAVAPPVFAQPAREFEANEQDRFIQVAADNVVRFLDSDGAEHAKKSIAEALSLPESVVATVLDRLIRERRVSRTGVGRGTKYLCIKARG